MTDLERETVWLSANAAFSSILSAFINNLFKIRAHTGTALCVTLLLLSRSDLRQTTKWLSGQIFQTKGTELPPLRPL